MSQPDWGPKPEEPKPNQPPSAELVAYRERVAWSMRMGFATQLEIANELGISDSAVSKILTRLSTRFAREFKEDVKLIRVQQTQQLSYIAGQAMSSWHKSLGVKKVKKTKSGVTGKGETYDEDSETEEQLLGDPRFLGEARGALADIRKIWGVDEAVKLELSGNSDEPVIVQVLRGVSMDDL